MTVGQYPHSLAYDPGKSGNGKIFVANGFDGTVSVISDSNNKVVATVTLPKLSQPDAVAYDSGKGAIFVANPGTNSAPGSVSVISDSTYAIIATVKVGTGPNAMVYDSGEGEVFVVNSVDGTVSVISDSSLK